MTGLSPAERTLNNGGHHAYPFLLAAGASLAAALIPTPAAAEESCDRRDKVLGQLAQKYQEIPVAIGVTSTGGLVEVLATGDGSTWTIIVTTPQGVSCLVAEGEGLRFLRRVERDPVA